MSPVRIFLPAYHLLIGLFAPWHCSETSSIAKYLKKKDAKNHKLILTNTKFRHISIHIFLCIKNYSKNYNGCKLYEEDKSLGNFGMMNEMYTDRYKREFQTKLGDAEAMHSSLYRSKKWLNWIAIPIFSGTNGFKSIYFVLKI